MHTGKKYNKKINIGFKYGKWFIIERDYTTRHKSIYVIVKCDCGTVSSVRYSAILKGKTTNCGCERKLRLEKYNKNRVTNGNPSRKSGTFEAFRVQAWGNINKRTINGSNPQETNKSYLVKGIELRMNKEQFYKFCDKNREIIEKMLKCKIYKEKPTIGRIDHNLHYSVDNIQIQSFSDNAKEAFERNKKLNNDGQIINEHL